MEAVGLAASILTFIDVGYKVAKCAYEIHHSGSTDENTRISALTQNLETAAAGLEHDPLLVEDNELLDICAKCRAESKKLAAVLDKLQVPEGARTFRKLKVVTKGLWKQKDIKDAEHALGEYRAAISIRLSAILWCVFRSPLDHQVANATYYSKEQSHTRDLLDSILKNAKEMANINGKELEKVQDKISKSLSHLKGLQQSSDELAQQLKDLQAVTVATRRGNYILRRLHFPEIFLRESDVQVAEQDTFGWIVGDPEPPHSDVARYCAFNSLSSFLRSSDGSILFFCGKAGSGKSTMMKFLSKHSAVCSGLEEWADGKKPIIVSMYFWNADSRLQRTIEGFYRTILFHTLSQCPELVAHVFPTEQSTRPTDLTIIAPFSVGELEEAFDRLVKLGDARDDFRFCYLIDGLDEYDGDNQSHRALAKKLVSWSSLDGVKIICSARPYTVFRDAFRDAGTTIEFHMLTRQDMHTFASRQFTTNLTHSVPLTCRDACLGFVDQIVTRADGVFSWASLVVRSLINGALDGDTADKLEERLEECPDKIEDMFEKMLSKVDPSPSVRRRSNMIMYLAAYNPLQSALNALTLAWLDDATWFRDGNIGTFPFDQQPRPYTESEIALKHANARKLLHSLTQGLLELKEATYGDQIPYFRYSIGFFHRSVHDFLRGHCYEPFGSQTALVEVYSRLRAAEVKFLASVPQELYQQLKLAPSVTNLYEYTFWWFGYLARKDLSPSYSCLREFELAVTSNIPWTSSGSLNRAFLPSESFWLLVFRGTMRIDGERSYRWETVNSGVGNLGGCSFLHWASYWFQGSHFRDQLCACDGSEELSALLSSSLASDVETTRFLLDQGRRPADCVRILCPGDNQQRISVWAVFLRDFANIVNQQTLKERARREWPAYLDSPWLSRLSAIIELYLRFGADPDAFYVVKVPTVEKTLREITANFPAGTPPSIRDGFAHAAARWKVYRVTLLQMLDVFKSNNLPSIHKLLGDSVLLDINSSRAKRLPRDTLVALRSELLPSPQLLKERDWHVVGVFLPGWGETLGGTFEVRVF